jgi:hypothetical protein
LLFSRISLPAFWTSLEASSLSQMPSSTLIFYLNCPDLQAWLPFEDFQHRFDAAVFHLCGNLVNALCTDLIDLSISED